MFIKRQCQESQRDGHKLGESIQIHIFDTGLVLKTQKEFLQIKRQISQYKNGQRLEKNAQQMISEGLMSIWIGVHH